MVISSRVGGDRSFGAVFDSVVIAVEVNGPVGERRFAGISDAIVVRILKRGAADVACKLPIDEISAGSNHKRAVVGRHGGAEIGAGLWDGRNSARRFGPRRSVGCFEREERPRPDRSHVKRLVIRAHADAEVTAGCRL